MNFGNIENVNLEEILLDCAPDGGLGADGPYGLNETILLMGRMMVVECSVANFEFDFRFQCSFLGIPSVPVFLVEATDLVDSGLSAGFGSATILSPIGMRDSCPGYGDWPSY